MPSREFLAFVKDNLTRSVPLTPRQWPSDADFAAMRQGEREDLARMDPAISTISLGGVECVDVGAGTAASERVIVYFHGGAYIYLSGQAFHATLSSMSRACEARCIAPNYRRAPEHPFPAPVEDALACYRALLESGVRPEQIVFSGDSAGGGLAIVTAIAARQQNLPSPCCVAAFSPWTDLTTSGRSADEIDDPIVDGAGLRWMAECYLAGADPKNPLASPLFAEPEILAKLPPVLVQVGSREALLDDSSRIADAIKDAGGSVEFVEHPDFVHMWMFYMPDFPETVHSFELVRDFIDKQERQSG